MPPGDHPTQTVGGVLGCCVRASARASVCESCAGFPMILDP